MRCKSHKRYDDVNDVAFVIHQQRFQSLQEYNLKYVSVFFVIAYFYFLYDQRDFVGKNNMNPLEKQINLFVYFYVRINKQTRLQN